MTINHISVFGKMDKPIWARLRLTSANWDIGVSPSEGSGALSSAALLICVCLGLHFETISFY